MSLPSPRVLRVPETVAVVVGILAVVAVAVTITVVFCSRSSHVVHRTNVNNIGNQVSIHAKAMAKSFSAQKDYRRVHMKLGVDPTVRNLTSKLPGLLKFSGEHITKSMLHEHASCAWARPSFWKAMRPTMLKLLDASHMPAPSLKPEPDLGVIHFRASDCPFNRHKHYHFMRYRWWAKAIRLKPEGVTRFKICFVNSHQKIGGDLSLFYFNHFLAFLNREFPQITFELFNTGSVNGDFQLMRRCRFLIAPGSSMSVVAAATGTQERAVFPTSVEARDRPLKKAAGHSWPDHMVELPRDALEHRDVVDYKDVAAVNRTLSIC